MVRYARALSSLLRSLTSFTLSLNKRKRITTKTLDDNRKESMSELEG